jgi:hypothetical protein
MKKCNHEFENVAMIGGGFSYDILQQCKKCMKIQVNSALTGKKR